MGRVSQAQAAQNRERIVGTAARLFRERGMAGVSVADVMAEAGLTHGGFYKHFASKDALVAEAVALAFTQQAAQLRDAGPAPSTSGPGSAGTDRRALVEAYLSTTHRDDPGNGCPTAGFGGDVARATGGDSTRAAYANGVEGFARMLSSDDDPDLVTLSTMVGALILSRATAGTALSDRLLAAAREALSGEGPGTPAP
jgi:TetR/AcrR family transcriptional repressor of nem operon